MSPTQPYSCDVEVEMGNRADPNSCNQPSVSFSKVNNVSNAYDLETEDATNSNKPYNLTDIPEAWQEGFYLKEQFYNKKKLEASCRNSSNSYSTRKRKSEPNT